MPTTSQALARQLHRWLLRASNKHEAQCEALPLRRDTVTLLAYVRDHKVIGTQNTGNFPLKVVREVTARFVKPPVLDHTIGSQTYRLRSEDDVWPLVFVHHLAWGGELLLLEPSRRWQLSPAGEHFLAAPSLFQVWVLLATWWHKVDWVVAYPFTGMAAGLPRRFRRTTLAHLLALPVETRIPFEGFADRLIQETGLTWPSADTGSHLTILRGAVRNMVVRILADFAVLEPEHEDRPLGKGTISELVAFRITPFGRDLLESVMT